MPAKERSLVSSRSYDIQLKIKDLDYTDNLDAVEIISSLSTGYQIIKLSLLVATKDVIIEDIFGKEPLKLKIRLLEQDKLPHEEIDMRLMYIKSDSKITQEDEMTTEKQSDRAPLVISTVCVKPFETLNTLVNKVYVDSTIRQMVEGLASEVGATLTYDSDGENTENIDQVCIPPTTFYKIIKEYNNANNDPFDGFIDQRFGLHEGVSAVFCQFDNKVYIKNLTAKMNKNQTFTVTQLATGTNNEKITEKVMDGKNFYVYDTIDSDYSGNAKFSVIAPNIKHIVKPKDMLFDTISQDLQSVCDKYSLVYKNNNMNINPSISRTKYMTEDTGYEKSENLFNARLGRSVSDASTISINLERNLKLLTLMNVGECVKFKPKTLEFTPLGGKYILWSSSINFVNTGDWESTARINLMRTNKKVF